MDIIKFDKATEIKEEIDVLHNFKINFPDFEKPKQFDQTPNAPIEVVIPKSFLNATLTFLNDKIGAKIIELEKEFEAL